MRLDTDNIGDAFFEREGVTVRVAGDVVDDVGWVARCSRSSD
jgi:hypothetical protein